MRYLVTIARFLRTSYSQYICADDGEIQIHTQRSQCPVLSQFLYQMVVELLVVRK